MKVSVCILSLYLLVLIVIPCVDLPKDNELGHTEFFQNTSESSPDDIDLCSPFCTCNCCVSPVVSQAYFTLVYQFMLLQEYNYDIITADISSPFVNIWQPPKIS